MRLSFLTKFTEWRVFLPGNLAWLSACFLLILSMGFQNMNKVKEAEPPPIRLIILDPGHFHAALVQKSMYKEISPVVHVYAPGGAEVKSYLELIGKYNSREKEPTQWEEKVYTGPDYLEKMLKDKQGNVVLIAGNNRKKTEYIKRSVGAGLNVFSDKPMAIDTRGFNLLKAAFASAEKNKVLLYDIMTERYEIINILQKELSHDPRILGLLEKGTMENPAITKESVHHFFKYVSGAPLIRPEWFFDVNQEGEGLVDITTHMVDLVQWECFPNTSLDYNKDVRMLFAKRWSTPITPSQFRQVTKKDNYPSYLRKDVQDSILNVYSNGEMNYTIKGVHARVSVIWNFQAPEGAGDTHYSIMRGSKANLVIRQGKEQQYKLALYIEPVNTDLNKYEEVLKSTLEEIKKTYPGLALKRSEKGWELIVPESYKIGHEAHFSEVTKKYLQYLGEGKMPDWEVPNMLAKYYTTTQALEKALENKR
jgi:predicted dehydrogenase